MATNSRISTTEPFLVYEIFSFCEFKLHVTQQLAFPEFILQNLYILYYFYDWFKACKSVSIYPNKQLFLEARSSKEKIWKLALACI